MGQSLDIVFEQVVRHPQPHRIHRCSFADGARQQHKRWVMRLLCHMGPCIQCSEAGQAVICQDDVKVAAICQFLEFCKSVHPPEVALKPGSTQSTRRQFVIGR